mgnify:CR=1 FL=1
MGGVLRRSLRAVERSLGLAAADQTLEDAAAGAVPPRKFGSGFTIFSCPVKAQQSRTGNRARVVMKADEGIELRLRRLRIAQRGRDIARARVRRVCVCV